MQPDLEKRARIRAILAYYRVLGEQTARARRKDMLPTIPKYEELEYVDGWVVWNGRPVCSPAEAGAAVSPGASLADVTPAEAAWLASTDHWSSAIEEKATLPSGASALRDRLAAECRFYQSLEEQARRAMRGEGCVPQVPDRTELQFMDGWLVCKGKPVWWSGQPTRSAFAAAARDSVDGAAPVEAAAPARERLKLRRLLALPWRRAAA